MQTYINKIFNKRIYLLILIFILGIQTSYTIDAYAYPINVKIIDKNEAKYNTPENAYISLISAMKAKDIDWYYNSLSEKTKYDEIELYEKYAFDINKKFQSIENVRQIIILEKKRYQDGVVLIVKTINNDDSVFEGPSIFVIENGLWKSKSAIAAEDPILDYLDYTPPPEYFHFFDLSVFPPKWNIAQHGSRSRHGHGKTSFHKDFKNTILCVLSPKEDEEVSVSDILPETLRLNHTVSPVPWHSSMREPSIDKAKYAYIISSPGDFPWPKRKEAVDWWERCAVKNDHRKPLMLVRFDMLEVMQTFLQEDAGNEYDVSITGTLKDGKEFKATARCHRN